MSRDISIVLPCLILNPFLLNLTKRCIDSIHATAPEAELIIIDCASPVGGDYLAEEADIYVRNKVRKGALRASNQGMKLASGKYVVLSNNDIVFSQDWKDTLCGMVDNFFGCGIACPHIAGQPVLDEVPWKSTTADGFLFFTHETLDRVGLFDETFLGCGALADWIFRMEKLGLYVYVTPEVIFEHYSSPTFMELIKRGEWSPSEDEMLGKKRWDEKWKNDPDYKEF